MDQSLQKIDHALSLVKAVEAQSMLDDAGGDEDENCRMLGRVGFDSTGQSQSPGVVHSSPDSATPHYFKPGKMCRILSMKPYKDPI